MNKFFVAVLIASIIPAAALAGGIPCYDYGPYEALHLQAKAPSGVKVTPVVSSTVTMSGQSYNFPQSSSEVVASIYEIDPGVALPIHKHSFPRFGYVISGTLRVENLETGQSVTFKSGDFILEAVGQWHRGTNVGANSLKVLVTDVVERGKSNTELQNQ